MSAADVVPGCYACDHTVRVDLPPREAIVRTSGWRVAHAFNATLPGWLVLDAARHVEAIADLTDAEGAELGVLLHRLSKALHAVTGCVKTYVMQFSEADGFAHLHVHLVPRMADQPPEHKGPRVFGYLQDGEAPHGVVPAQEQDRLALEIRSHVVDLEVVR